MGVTRHLEPIKSYLQYEKIPDIVVKITLKVLYVERGKRVLVEMEIGLQKPAFASTKHDRRTSYIRGYCKW